MKGIRVRVIEGGVGWGWLGISIVSLMQHEDKHLTARKKDKKSERVHKRTSR